METNLLPCPFCGSGDLYVTHTRYYDPEDTVCVFCNSCKTVVTLEANEAEGLGEAEKRRAVAAWNARAEIPRLTCELEEVESYSNALEVIHVLECSECGETCEHTNGSYPRCPHCGRKVVEHG